MGKHKACSGGESVSPQFRGADLLLDWCAKETEFALHRRFLLHTFVRERSYLHLARCLFSACLAGEAHSFPALRLLPHPTVRSSALPIAALSKPRNNNILGPQEQK